MKLSERLKLLREETGLSQKEFATGNGIEPSKYNKWENGKNSPGYEDICALARLFHVSTDYLLGVSESKNEKHAEELAKEMKTLIDALGNEKLVSVLKRYGEGGLRSNRPVSDLLADMLNTHWFSNVLFNLDSYVMYDEDKAGQFRTLQMSQKEGNIHEVEPKAYPEWFMQQAQNQIGNTCMQLRQDRLDKEKEAPNAET